MHRENKELCLYFGSTLLTIFIGCLILFPIIMWLSDASRGESVTLFGEVCRFWGFLGRLKVW